MNGRLVGEEQARISVFDRGFLYGDGIFESMRALGGVVFRERRHLERLQRSAERVGLETSSFASGLESACRELLEVNRLKDARVRITVSRGEGRPGEYIEASGTPTVVISAAPFAGIDEERRLRGVKVVIPPFRQIPPESLDPAIKSTSRLWSVLARRHAQERGGFEAVLLDSSGHLTEGTVSNFFLVVGGRLMTTPVPEGGLPGITREAVLELARTTGIETSEERLPESLLDRAGEAFLTNSSWEVLPVVEVQSRPIGRGVPGPVTLRLGTLYRDLLRRECGVPTDGAQGGPGL